MKTNKWKEELIRYINNEDISDLYDPSLIKEMQDFAENPSRRLAIKAQRIYLIALNRRKTELATRIKSKYGMLFGHDDDVVMAYGMALLAHKNSPTPKIVNNSFKTI